MNSPEAQAIRREYDPKLAALAKDIKKKKGGYKKKAQEQYDEVKAEYDAKMAAFKGGGAPEESKQDKEESKPKVAKLEVSKEDLNGMSKKELIKQCEKVGVGKKGSKEVYKASTGVGSGGF